VCLLPDFHSGEIKISKLRKKHRHLHHCTRTALSGYIFATKAHIGNRKKNH